MLSICGVMSTFTESNLNNLDTSNESSTTSQKVFQNFASSAEQSDVSALLQTIIDNQYSLREEIVDELENSRCQIRSFVLPMLNELSERVNTNVFARCKFTGSFAKHGFPLTKSIPHCVETSREGDDSKQDFCEQTATLAKKLIHDQHKFRRNIFSLLRDQTEEIIYEMLSSIDSTKTEIDQKLKSVETDAEMLLPLYERTFNSVSCIFSLIEVAFDSMNAKVDILEQKLKNFENSTAAIVMSFPNEYKSNNKILYQDSDTNSVSSYQTDTGSILHDLKIMVTRQNLNTSAQRHSNDGNLKHTINIMESPMKVEENTKTNWLQERVPVEYDEDVFWNQFPAYVIKFMPTETLTTHLKTLVILSVTHEKKQKFFDFALYCAMQLRNPNRTNELLSLNTEGLFIYEDGAPTMVQEPPIDWKTLSANADDIFVSLTEMEQKFIENVMQMDDGVLVIWGCAYACVLTQLYEKGIISIVDKLEHLNDELEQIYNVNKDQLPAIPICESFVSKLQGYTGFELDKNTRNTFFKGIIGRYESFDVKNVRRLLDYLILDSLRYKGMPLLTLVYEVLKIYQIQLDELMSCTTYSKTIDSWKNVYSFVSTKLYLNSEKWKYCAVFEPTSYSIFSLDANFCLCTLLCLLIDEKCVKSNQSNKLYYQLQQKIKPEWFTNEFISNYVKTSLKHLRKYSEVL